MKSIYLSFLLVLNSAISYAISPDHSLDEVQDTHQYWNQALIDIGVVHMSLQIEHKGQTEAILAIGHNRFIKPNSKNPLQIDQNDGRLLLPRTHVEIYFHQIKTRGIYFDPSCSIMRVIYKDPKRQTTQKQDTADLILEQHLNKIRQLGINPFKNSLSWHNDIIDSHIRMSCIGRKFNVKLGTSQFMIQHLKLFKRH